MNISPQSVSKWENGDALPSILFLPKLAECFGCDINDFFAVADVSNYDLKMLKEEYDIISIQPVDMFPNTYHVETVCALTLKN